MITAVITVQVTEHTASCWLVVCISEPPVAVGIEVPCALTVVFDPLVFPAARVIFDPVVIFGAPVIFDPVGGDL